MLIDLPSKEQRRQIFSVHLKEEVLDEGLSLEELATKTEHYSGSDLKNVCVAAALARVKETVVKEVLSDSPSEESVDLEMIKEKLSTLEDWNSVLEKTPSVDRSSSLGPLTSDHFQTAFKEVPPSLTDEMQTLIELRKWDKLYGESGDGRSRSRTRANAWGF